MQNKYYVYLHKYKYGPKAGQVFYVGKGKNRRAWDVASRGALWLSCVVESGREVEIYKDNLPEECAYTLERILVECYRKSGQCEANLTDGGKGAIGSIRSAEANEATARVLRKKIYSSLGEEFASLEDAASYLRGIGYRAERSSAISSVAHGRLNYAYDRVWSFDGFPDHTPLRPTICCSNGMKFESQSRAVRWLRSIGHEKANTQKISMCVRGMAKSSYGFAWAWNEFPEQPEFVGAEARTKSRSRTVYCSNGMEFDCLKSAADWVKSTGIDSASTNRISAIAVAGIGTAYGYGWAYEKTPN